MNFLNMAALGLLGLIPPVVALYFLKLKRPRRLISSSLLLVFSQR